jgi:hypothetical protein
VRRRQPAAASKLFFKNHYQQNCFITLFAPILYTLPLCWTLSDLSRRLNLFACQIGTPVWIPGILPSNSLD